MADTTQRRDFPDSSVGLYFGKVMHARKRPKTHRFEYRVFSMVIDLDELSAANHRSWIFSVNKPNFSSFYEKDHGKRDGSSLRSHVDAVLKDYDLPPAKRVLLWCNPRVLGYCFNPLSVYFCYDDNDEVFALLYQVHNTFGQTHTYVAPAEASQSGQPISQSSDKRFYVSPFLEMKMRYDFTVLPPDQSLKVNILEYDSDGLMLTANFTGTYQALTNRALSRGILESLGLSWKVMFAIHYEALKLWLKGIKLQKRPLPPQETSRAIATSMVKDTD